MDEIPLVDALEPFHDFDDHFHSVLEREDLAR
jgi:hypothetical protein